MSVTKIKKCGCTSEFQDEFYGKGMRLHNVNAEGNRASCTVCEGSAKNAKRTDGKSRPYKQL